MPGRPIVRITPTTTFETFPEGLTPDIPAAACADDPRAIAAASKRLNELRDAWLNPAGPGAARA